MQFIREYIVNGRKFLIGFSAYDVTIPTKRYVLYVQAPYTVHAYNTTGGHISDRRHNVELCILNYVSFNTILYENVYDPRIAPKVCTHKVSYDNK